MRNRLIVSAFALLFPWIVSADEGDDQLWNQIGFIATEVLIYTDQLAKLNATPCNPSAVVGYNTDATREELLKRLPESPRSRLAALFDSPLVAQMLDENSKGIEAMLGKPALTGALNDKQRAACLELSMAFSDNRQQAEEDLQALLLRAGVPLDKARN